MNVFEEHQLFIPIINDSRFALRLADECRNGRRVIFNRYVLEAVHKVRVEANLSISTENREAVQQELWEYYKRLEDEERDKAVYAAEGFDAKPSQAERELREWKLEAGRIAHEAFGMVDALQYATTRRIVDGNNLSLLKESLDMATNKPDTFQTKHLVDGVDVNELSDDYLIDAIKSLEKQTTELQAVKTESKKITARIASLNVQREAIVALLDARA